MSSEVEVAPLTRAQAVALTNQINKSLTLAWDLLIKAYHGRVWTALGYATWDAYCKSELGNARLGLPAEERQQRVRSLREQGLSTRAIASATGVSDWTIRDDLSRARNLAPDDSDPAVIGVDGKVYPQPEKEEVIDAEIVEEDDVPEAAVRSNRSPLPKQFRKPVMDLDRAARRIEALSQDDRMRSNSRNIRELYYQQLVAAHAALGEFIALLEKNNGAVR